MVKQKIDNSFLYRCNINVLFLGSFWVVLPSIWSRARLNGYLIALENLFENISIYR